MEKEIKLNLSKQNSKKKGDSNPTVDVGGYRVKTEYSPLLTAIFTKYGDIAKESDFSMESRAVMLEMVCGIYSKLEASTFVELTPSDLKSMVGQMKDLELVKMEIGWLKRRLVQIWKAREAYGDVSRVEEAVAERERSVEMYEKKVVAGMEAVKKLQELVEREKKEAEMARGIHDLCAGSLVHLLV